MLIDKLSNIDKTSLIKKDIDEISKMINDIKKIANEIPNKEDEYIIKKKENINNIIKKIEQIPKNNDSNDILNNKLNNLKNAYAREMDSYERWFAIVDYIDKNNYFIKTFESLTDYELLEFIAQYIQAPFPPNLNQEEFDKLVKVGIENDEREWLWRLAFNYEKSKIKFDEIVNYFIKVKDGYYLSELISAVGKCLNIDRIVAKIDDKKLIEDLKKRKKIISLYVSNKQYNKLMEKIDKK